MWWRSTCLIWNQWMILTLKTGLPKLITPKKSLKSYQLTTIMSKTERAHRKDGLTRRGLYLIKCFTCKIQIKLSTLTNLSSIFVTSKAAKLKCIWIQHPLRHHLLMPRNCALMISTQLYSKTISILIKSCLYHILLLTKTLDWLRNMMQLPPLSKAKDCRFMKWMVSMKTYNSRFHRSYLQFCFSERACILMNNQCSLIGLSCYKV